MATVFIVQHLHVHPDGEQDLKLVGVYSSSDLALDAVSRLRTQPGFCKHPRLIDPLCDDDASGFYVDEYTLDRDSWSEGYVTI